MRISWQENVQGVRERRIYTKYSIYLITKVSNQTHFSGEATRQRSFTLRGTIDAILNNAARDLRSQADRVELALSRRIACVQEVTYRLENELKQVLRKLADIEDLIAELRSAIRRMDTPMKKAQTRLDNRLYRPR